MENWRIHLDTEFERAKAARSLKNEGQARVCARRAAGIAIREFLSRRGIRAPSTSAFDLLNLLKDDPSLPAEIKPSVEYLILRVTEEFKLPVDRDLVHEARRLCKWLLPDWE